MTVYKKVETLGTSPLAPYAGRDTRWIPGDDEKKYKHHMENRRETMEKWGWDGPRGEFTYKFNSHGFRADEFSNEPSVMFIGCSMTMGVGIELENTWAHMVARDLGLKNHNLATGGSSNDASFRLFNHWHRIHRPELVVYYSPPRERMEIVTLDRKMVNLLPQGHVVDNMYKQWILAHYNGEFNQQKNVMAVELLCRESNIPLVWLPHEQMFKTSDGFESIPYEYGRDLLHPGNGWHRNMHKRVMSLINEL